MIRVLLVDDQALIRSGLRSVLDREPDIEVVGEAADDRAAVTAVRQLKPDLVLMDIRMPEQDGISASRAVLAVVPEPPRVLILTTYDLDEYVYAGLRAVSSGFLLKDAEQDRIVASVRRRLRRGDARPVPDPAADRDVRQRAAPGRHPAHPTHDAGAGRAGRQQHGPPVKVVIENDAGESLLIERSDNGNWALPVRA